MQKKIILFFTCVALIFSMLSFATDISAKTTKQNFMKDPKKVYTYQYTKGYQQSIKAHSTSTTKKQRHTVWLYLNQENTHGLNEQQTSKYYSISYSGSEIRISRTPKVGNKIYSLYYGTDKVYEGKVISTRATVKTKYKTFKNCVVVKTKNEKIYYADHYGIVKRVDSKGKVLEQLIKVK